MTELEQIIFHAYIIMLKQTNIMYNYNALKWLSVINTREKIWWLDTNKLIMSDLLWVWLRGLIWNLLEQLKMLYICYRLYMSFCRTMLLDGWSGTGKTALEDDVVNFVSIIFVQLVDSRLKSFED